MTAASYSYRYPRPGVTVDLVLVSREQPLRVLLIRRAKDPFAGAWALPGGFVDEMEPLIDAARRELREETGVVAGDLEQLQAFGDPGRDPRGWTISITFLGRLNPEDVSAKAGDDAAAAEWFPLDQLPTLAFDHAEILQVARHRLRPPRKRRS